MADNNIDIDKLDLNEGTFIFWVRENKLMWDDNNSTVIFNISKNNGSLFMVKDNDNKLKFFHVILGRGRTDVEIDVTSLDSKLPHMVAITWDINTKKEISISIDGKPGEHKKIDY